MTVEGETVQVWNRGTSASANLFYNADHLDSDYNGVDLMATKRMSNRWSLLAGASFGRARSATRGGDRANPNNTENPYDDNPLNANDRPWSTRASGNYEAPYQIFVSGTWQFQSGAPETTTVLVPANAVTPNLAQGAQAVQVLPTGDVRFPNIAQLDLSIRKSFRLGGSKRFTPRLDVFNLTNESSITSWVTQLGPTYHRPSLIQHGRMWKFDFTYDF